jgi:hypothetical protein
MISIAGLKVAIVPECEITEAEHLFLSRFSPALSATEPDITVRLAAIEAGHRADLTNDDPVAVEWRDGALRLSHRFIHALIPVSNDDVIVHRDRKSAIALHLTLRTVIAARLPGVGALPLHATGVVMDGRAVLLYGPSGAGKSTIAGRSSLPLLSDELVVVHVDTLEASAAGFWGELDRSEAPKGRYPIAALLELAKGPRLAITAQSADEARRKLVAALLVPPAPPLWSLAIDLADRLARNARAARLEWSLDDEPWSAIGQFLESPR